MRHLTKEQILLIHSMLVDETGGMHGVLDHGALLSIEALPKQKVFGKEIYPTVFDKAAAYAKFIIANHPFLDGNKRTGISASLVFLENNGYITEANRGEIEDYAVKIALEKLEISEIAVWLKKHSEKQK